MNQPSYMYIISYPILVPSTRTLHLDVITQSRTLISLSLSLSLSLSPLSPSHVHKHLLCNDVNLPPPSLCCKCSLTDHDSIM